MQVLESEAPITTSGDPSVVIDLGYTRVVFCNCVAEKFKNGDLAISRADTDEEVERFEHGGWRVASAINGRGEVTMTFKPVVRA